MAGVVNVGLFSNDMSSGPLSTWSTTRLPQLFELYAHMPYVIQYSKRLMYSLASALSKMSIASNYLSATLEPDTIVKPKSTTAICNYHVISASLPIFLSNLLLSTLRFYM